MGSEPHILTQFFSGSTFHGASLINGKKNLKDLIQRYTLSSCICKHQKNPNLDIPLVDMLQRREDTPRVPDFGSTSENAKFGYPLHFMTLKITLLELAESRPIMLQINKSVSFLVI